MTNAVRPDRHVADDDIHRGQLRSHLGERFLSPVADEDGPIPVQQLLGKRKDDSGSPADDEAMFLRSDMIISLLGLAAQGRMRKAGPEVVYNTTICKESRRGAARPPSL